jgi:hypothetical protein
MFHRIVGYPRCILVTREHFPLSDVITSGLADRILLAAFVLSILLGAVSRSKK